MTRPIVLAALVLVCTGTGCSPSGEAPPCARDTLVVMTTRETLASAGRDRKPGDIPGMDLAIVREVAARLGKRLEIRPAEFSSLLPSVKRGDVDFAAAMIVITPSRTHDVDFSDAYALDGSAFLYRAGEPRPTVPTAFLQRIGVQTASISQLYLCAHRVDAICYETYDETVREFAAGRLDAVFNDAATIRATVEASKGAWAMTDLVTRERYGIAVRKGNRELLNALNDVIRTWKEAR